MSSLRSMAASLLYSFGFSPLPSESTIFAICNFSKMVWNSTLRLSSYCSSDKILSFTSFRVFSRLIHSSAMSLGAWIPLRNFIYAKVDSSFSFRSCSWFRCRESQACQN
jgi:hypothetical protein